MALPLMAIDLFVPTRESLNAPAILVVESVTESPLTTPLRAADDASRIEVAFVVASYTRFEAVTPEMVSVLAQILAEVVGWVSE